MLVYFFTGVWMISLLIFLIYTLISIFFRSFSYPTDYIAFAGNQVTDKVDKQLRYFIIVPCFNEEAVIKQTIQHLLGFGEFEVVVVDDASTDNSAAEIRQIRSPRLHLLQRQLPDAHTGKGDVLNFALDYIRQQIKQRGTTPEKTIVGVVDADAELAPNAAQRLNGYFSSPAGNVCQMRVKMYPHFKTELQILQDIEFFSINHMTQIMRMYTRTVGLSGNGQFFRLAPILAKIGPHPWGNALLDDYELTIKMLLKGLHVDYMTETYVYQEALASLKKFIRQRSLWVQGDLNCLKYLPAIVKSRRLKTTQKTGIYYFLCQPWINALADTAIIVLTVFSFFHLDKLFGNLPGLALIAMVVLVALFSLLWGIVFSFFYRHDLRHFDEPAITRRQYLLLPFGVSYLYVVLFFSIVMAFWRWLFHENSWIKTEHGKG